ncbi:hypothetical protein D3Z52_02485 [Clostridiaceae bacterium]|nr:hypothetical protein [Clostridiaceae bacterium]
MKSFTPTEVAWIVKLLDDEAKRLEITMTAGEATSMEQAIAAHMLENYQSIKGRLTEVVERKDKRMAIKY